VKFGAALLAIALNVLAAMPAFACTCIRGDEDVLAKFAREQLMEGAVFFQGEVLSSKNSPERDASTKFRVIDVLAGKPGKVITVRHSTETAMCGVTFAKGETRFVFANKDGKSYITSSCAEIMATRLTESGKAWAKSLMKKN
jgi:hypothetical protein